MKLKLKHIYIPEVNHEFDVTEDDLSSREKFVSAIKRSWLDIDTIVADSMEFGRQSALEQLKGEAKDAPST